MLFYKQCVFKPVILKERCVRSGAIPLATYWRRGYGWFLRHQSGTLPRMNTGFFRSGIIPRIVLKRVHFGRFHRSTVEPEEREITSDFRCSNEIPVDRPTVQADRR
ncbi:hypothetical protein KCP73_16125 [Salmonella enterica subsp. enterica]|nr:hypothetical protein KCP73_16125 [Salmonella enterica subsp. enterica]